MQPHTGQARITEQREFQWDRASVKAALRRCTEYVNPMEMAKRWGISRSMVRRYLDRNEDAIPPMDRIMRLAFDRNMKPCEDGRRCVEIFARMMCEAAGAHLASLPESAPHDDPGALSMALQRSGAEAVGRVMEAFGSGYTTTGQAVMARQAIYQLVRLALAVDVILEDVERNGVSGVRR